VVLCLSYLGVFIGLSAHAGEPYQRGAVFDLLRMDRTVPKKCREVSVSRFSSQLQTITVGISGAMAEGFSQEYPLQRQDARYLWGLIKNESPEDHQHRRVEQHPNLARDYEILRVQGAERGFAYESEGEVLEVLALEYLVNLYGEDRVFATGSVAYHHLGEDRYIGELDLLVGDRSTCEIFVVGEAKLGIGMLSKALQQIDRFMGFLGNHRRQRQMWNFSDYLWGSWQERI
jgi:hypothetical protein